jgi:hypothetical protein
MASNYFGFIELELKPTPKVLNVLKRLGHNWVELGKPKIVYVPKMCYKGDDHEAICQGDLDLLRIRKFSKEDILKVRPAASRNLCGNSVIHAGLLMERYLFQDRTRVVMAQKKPAKNHCVYLLRMATSAFDDYKVKRQNQDIPRSDYAIYVGTTSNKRSVRFDQHTNPKNPKYNLRSKVFSSHAFSTDFEVCNLTEVYRKELGTIDGLTDYESKAKEWEISQMLRDDFGIWAYSN